MCTLRRREKATWDLYGTQRDLCHERGGLVSEESADKRERRDEWVVLLDLVRSFYYAISSDDRFFVSRFQNSSSFKILKSNCNYIHVDLNNSLVFSLYFGLVREIPVRSADADG